MDTSLNELSQDLISDEVILEFANDHLRFLRLVVQEGTESILPSAVVCDSSSKDTTQYIWIDLSFGLPQDSFARQTFFSTTGMKMIVLEKLSPCCIIFCFESWSAMVDNDKEKINEILKKYGSLENYPDRKEVLVLSLLSLDGRQINRLFPIERNPESNQILFNEKLNDNFTKEDICSPTKDKKELLAEDYNLKSFYQGVQWGYNILKISDETGKSPKEVMQEGMQQMLKKLMTSGIGNLVEKLLKGNEQENNN